MNKDNLAFVVAPDKTEEFLKAIKESKGNLKKVIDRIEKRKKILNKKSSSVVTEELSSQINSLIVS